MIDNTLVSDWANYLNNRDYSRNTIDNYTSDVKQFLKWISLKNGIIFCDTEHITLPMVEQWRNYLSSVKTPATSIYYTIRPTISPATIQSKLTAIKSLLRYLNTMYDEWLNYRKIEQKRIKTHYIECLTDSEFKFFFNFIDQYEKYKINSLRMQLLCNIWYTSWLRLSEMLGLKIEDIKAKETRITWKGNKTRWAFFTDSTEELLEEYLSERSKPIPWTWKVENWFDYVFISHNSWYDYGHPLRKNTVCEIMKKYSDNADLWKRVTVHTLRHSYATKLIESGFNIREIQELLGHCDIQTTEWYCHVLKSNLKDKVGKIFD